MASKAGSGGMKGVETSGGLFSTEERGKSVVEAVRRLLERTERREDELLHLRRTVNALVLDVFDLSQMMAELKRSLQSTPRGGESDTEEGFVRTHCECQRDLAEFGDDAECERMDLTSSPRKHSAGGE